ncbi:MAG: hypothetical protein KA109_11420 [Saprospiraceae bacterium]|nr:hypothetical protein [Saprospiraceae bacterium]MBK7607895.1 hypothetical protein [Saprospiraceae bacterium]MBP7802224.1 hypothetical protein [Saprospiraceae bacterium]MBP8095040.1 hypothetical protein [Saprospiraceae bacterium]
MINNDDQYHELPEWQDDFMDEEEEGESWKPNPTRDACKAMYEQWNEVVLILKAAFDSLKEPKDNDRFDKEYTEEFKASLLSDAFQVAIKIRSSVVDLYMLKMENACLIRKNAENIWVATNHFLLTGTMEEKHYYIVRAEIDQFRELFKIWVSTFEKDEHEDEWGLFN